MVWQETKSEKCKGTDSRSGVVVSRAAHRSQAFQCEQKLNQQDEIWYFMGTESVSYSNPSNIHEPLTNPPFVG